MKNLLMLSTALVTAAGVAMAQDTTARTTTVPDSSAGSAVDIPNQPGMEQTGSEPSVMDRMTSPSADDRTAVMTDGEAKTVVRDEEDVIREEGEAQTGDARAQTEDDNNLEPLSEQDLDAAAVGDAPAQERALAAEPGVRPPDQNLAIEQSGVQQQHPMTRENYTAVDQGTLGREDLTGMRVYDANDQWIGEISDLTLEADGTIEYAIVDVGGFLGLGEKPVALAAGDLALMKQDGGTDIVAYTQMTETELEQMPEWEE